MSYQAALEAAGAKVLAFGEFGDYQGTWIALVEYAGKKGYVEGGYGSCSGCDAFEGEFGYNELDGECEVHRWQSHQPNCPLCVEAKEAAAQKLIDFGKSYLDTIMSKDEALVDASKALDWDGEATKMIDWIKKWE